MKNFIKVIVIWIVILAIIIGLSFVDLPLWIRIVYGMVLGCTGSLIYNRIK